MKFRILALALLALAQVPTTTSAQPEGGTAILRRALDQTYSFTATVILRRAYWSGESSMFSATFVKDQGYKAVMIHPSMSAGQTQVDQDGKMLQWRPDDGVVLNRVSLDQFTPDLDTRIRWTTENYEISVEGEEVRLGRRAFRLVLSSKHGSDMGSHTFLVDQKLPLVLSESASAAGQSLLVAEVVGLREDPDATLDLTLPERAQHRKIWGPQPVRDMKYAASAIGFTPRSPVSLPFNFQYFAQQLVGDESNPFIVFRITDGLSMAHIYQWRYEKGKRPERSGIRAVRIDEGRDIAFGIVADCPPRAQKKLLDAFAGVE